MAVTSFMEGVLSIWLKKRFTLSLEILEPGGEIRFLKQRHILT